MVFMLALFLAPLALFTPLLARARRTALGQYAAFVALQDRAVHEAWVVANPVIGPGRDAVRPELELTTNANALYEAVAAMRTLPVGRKALLAVLVPAGAPLLLVVTAEIPLRTLLLSIMKTLT
jgi:hypothetical protein